MKTTGLERGDNAAQPLGAERSATVRDARALVSPPTDDKAIYIYISTTSSSEACNSKADFPRPLRGGFQPGCQRHFGVTSRNACGDGFGEVSGEVSGRQPTRPRRGLE